LGFRDRVRVTVKVRVSFRIATFTYKTIAIWPPGLVLELVLGSVLD